MTAPDAPRPAASIEVLDELADWLHPWLEGRPYCAYDPKTLCVHTRRSKDLARALLVEGGWVEEYMRTRIGPVAEAEPTDPQWVFSEEAAARLIASVAWPFERRENRESWAPRLLAEPEMLEQEYRSAVARLRSAYAKCFVAAARAAAEQAGGDQ